jgi:hypothetical protein
VTARILETDDFDRADENPIASPWVNGVVFGGLKLVGNRVQGGTASIDCCARLNKANIAADGFAQCTLAQTGATEGGLTFRHSTIVDTFYLADIDMVANFSRIYSCVATVFTSLAAVSATWVANDIAKLTCVGSALTFLKNGITSATATNTTITAAGQAGMLIFGNLATLELDNFLAGDFPPFDDYSLFPKSLIAEAAARGEM